MALLSNDRRSASVVALTPVSLNRISKERIRKLTDTCPELTACIQRHIHERSRELILREHFVKITGVDVTTCISALTVIRPCVSQSCSGINVSAS